jgi:hypothetical protein
MGTTYTKTRRRDMSDLLWHPKALLKRLNWLAPPEHLDATGGTTFGRSIETELRSLGSQHQGVLKLRLRKRDAAVVISLEHYQQLLEMKDLCRALIDAQADAVINEAASEFDALYEQLTSEASRSAADALFQASPEDLRQSYRPGGTEKQ